MAAFEYKALDAKGRQKKGCLKAIMHVRLDNSYAKKD